VTSSASSGFRNGPASFGRPLGERGGPELVNRLHRPDAIEVCRVGPGVDARVGFEQVVKCGYAPGDVAVFGKRVGPPISSIEPQGLFLLLNLMGSTLRILEEKPFATLEDDYGGFVPAVAVDAN
jgi:hypothetical protein